MIVCTNPSVMPLESMGISDEKAMDSQDAPLASTRQAGFISDFHICRIEMGEQSVISILNTKLHFIFRIGQGFFMAEKNYTFFK